MSATDDARLRELLRKADLPDTSLTDRKLYTVEAACRVFLSEARADTQADEQI
jgi:hypothetical protein